MNKENLGIYTIGDREFWYLIVIMVVVIILAGLVVTLPWWLPFVIGFFTGIFADPIIKWAKHENGLDNSENSR